MTTVLGLPRAPTAVFSARNFANSSSSGSWFNFWDGEAVREVGDIRVDEDLAPLWKMSQAQLHELWEQHDPDGTGVVSHDKAASLVRRILDTQRKTLTTIIAEQHGTKNDLLGDMSSWLPKWKQWGVTVNLEDQENKIQAAEKLLAKLHDPQLEASILEALHPSKLGGDVTHFNFFNALTTDAVREAELEALEEQAREEDLVAELADAAEPVIVAQATAAEIEAKKAHEAAVEAKAIAAAAAAAEAEAVKKAEEAKKRAEAVAEQVHGSSSNSSTSAREGTTEAGDEELDYMDLLASLDLLDYSEILFVLHLCSASWCTHGIDVGSSEGMTCVLDFKASFCSSSSCLVVYFVRTAFTCCFLRDSQQITTVEDLKLLTKEDLRDMGFSVGAGNRLYKWVRLHRSGEDEDL